MTELARIGSSSGTPPIERKIARPASDIAESQPAALEEKYLGSTRPLSNCRPPTISQPVDAMINAESRNFLPVPDTYQGTDYSCGASALQAVLMFWGKEYGETELMDKLHTDPKDGTNPRDIVRVAQDLGLKAELRDNLALSDLEAPLKHGLPVIVALQAWRDGEDMNRPWSEVWESGHYMVLIGMDEKNLYFEDPSLLGSRGFIPRTEFVERWHDVDDRKYVHSAIFFDGAKPAPPPPFIHVEMQEPPAAL